MGLLSEFPQLSTLNSPMQLSVSHSFLPKQNTSRASMVMDHFGIDFEQGQHTIADNLELPIEAGNLVLFTGESGAGKSSLMRAAVNQLSESTAKIINLDDLQLSNQLLIDSLPTDLIESLAILSDCGLGEAQLMLRTPSELSDGQRYRFRLALALSQKGDWIIADEFTATLDRTLAKVIAFNIRKLCNRNNLGFMLATTHSDVVEDLAPDVHVHCNLNGTIEINRSNGTENTAPCKKKDSHSPATCGSPPPPSPTGRTSLGGIIAHITSVSSSR